jgi:hypothetical protein
MPRAHRSKVTLIQRGNLGFVESFDKSDDTGVDDAEPKVVICLLKFPASCEALAV